VVIDHGALVLDSPVDKLKSDNPGTSMENIIAAIFQQETGRPLEAASDDTPVEEAPV